jgi:glutamate---cysteine ligase / carboxylate-amine ligase
LPGAAHPWMDPMRETVLWQHENSEIYDTYNRIFDCRGHGWSNLQSTHINLPFVNDDEFGRLHAAIRLLLPIIPAITASSPVMDGNFTGWHDTRLRYYQSNQATIPSITGRVVPEAVFTEKDYQKNVFEVISRDIAPHDPNQILEPIWLNSRGAIARFDRGAIEIRTIDIQECPNADLASLSLIIGALKLLVEEQQVPLSKQKTWAPEPLYQILNKIAIEGEEAKIDSRDYLDVFGINHVATVRAKDVWDHILDQLVKHDIDNIGYWMPQLQVILKQGTLSTRIMKALGHGFSKGSLEHVYRELGNCLQQNKMFTT